MEYKASMDTLCKVLTAGVFILLLAIGQRSVRALMVSQGDFITILIHSSLLLLFIIIVLFSYLYAPKQYIVSNNEFIIKRPIKDKVLNISDMSEIQVIDSKDLTGTIRTFGNGGFFGYYGKYYNSKLGSMTWYVTQRKNRILITTTNGKKIVISPDDISLMEVLQSRMKK